MTLYDLVLHIMVGFLVMHAAQLFMFFSHIKTWLGRWGKHSHPKFALQLLFLLASPRPAGSSLHSIRLTVSLLWPSSTPFSRFPDILSAHSRMDF